MFRKLNLTTVMTMALVASGCLGGSTPTADPTNGTVPGAGTTPGTGDPGGASGVPENTFDHTDLTVDPFAVLSREQVEGPPEISTRARPPRHRRVTRDGHRRARRRRRYPTGRPAMIGSLRRLLRAETSAIGSSCRRLAKRLLTVNSRSLPGLPLRRARRQKRRRKHVRLPLPSR